jgi:hypothetical protein
LKVFSLENRSQTKITAGAVMQGGAILKDLERNNPTITAERTVMPETPAGLAQN